MLRPRIIACLLIHNGGLVKTQVFTNPIYLGDPLNAVKIFNEKEADELLVLDIDATVNKVEPDFNLISKLAAECRMPLCYGGGVSTPEQVSRIVDMGIEKVAISSAAIDNPNILSQMANAVGRQSIVAVIDVRKSKGFFTNKYEVYTRNGKTYHNLELLSLAKQLQDAGAGEIVINSIDRDGLMEGYDIELVKYIKKTLRIPVTFLGGAGTLNHLYELISIAGVVGAAAGSLFVYKGKYRAVLINYPSHDQRNRLFQDIEI